MNLVDIIIPTFDNVNFLVPCINSILSNQSVINKIIIVNNGKNPIDQYVVTGERIEIVNAGKNLGWEGGLKLGLTYSKAPFVCFMNDDTFIPRISMRWLEKMLYLFADKSVAAVGPTTNCAAGLQNIFHCAGPSNPTEVTFLIGFCVLLKRSYLDEVGGVDDTLPGGDDFDLSIRLRKAGYKLMIQPESFVYHHGFVTGSKVNGDQTHPGGWNSREMTDKTNHALIVKHGFKEFMLSLSGHVPTDVLAKKDEDQEGDIIRTHISSQKVLELGCGAKKTVSNAVGVDLIPRGEIIHGLPGNALSVADVVADVSKPLPFGAYSFDCVIARHVLEHCLDTVETLKEWGRVIKPGGKLILALPDQGLGETIPMNPQHVHAFTKESIANLLELLGYKNITKLDTQNGVSFVVVAERGALC